MAEFVPRKSDVIWIDCDPQVGREQAKRRPFLVLSPAEYNKRTGLVIGCPITSKQKAYPFEVAIKSAKLKGTVLADHIKSFDWRARNAALLARSKSHNAALHAVQERISLLLGLAA